MGVKVQVAEYLDVDLEAETWHCHECGNDLGPAAENYKHGCRVNRRDPSEVHRPIIDEEEFNFAPDPGWVQILEFYCPSCAVMIENEYLPPGHPITNDTQFDLEFLRQKHLGD